MCYILSPLLGAFWTFVTIQFFFKCSHTLQLISNCSAFKRQNWKTCNIVTMYNVMLRSLCILWNDCHKPAWFHLGMISHPCPFYSDNLKEQIYYVYLSACAFPPLTLCYKGTQMMCSQGISRDMCALSVKPKGNQFRVSREFPVNAFIQHFTSTGSLGAADACSSWRSLNEAEPS